MSSKNMEKAEENLRYATLGFKEGVIDTSNVLEAQTCLLYTSLFNPTLLVIKG